jgi:hypothetical protein
MTEYLTHSNRNMHWEQREDTMNPFVRKALSRNMFIDIIQHSYFVDSVAPYSNDWTWKVRSLFKQIKKTAKAYVKQPQNVSIDEGIEGMVLWLTPSQAVHERKTVQVWL